MFGQKIGGNMAQCGPKSVVRNGSLGRGIKSCAAFTLPEVIVAFSVLVLVIVSASNVLAVVMRTNADNVNSLVAYGLAQEGLENMRFIRDSNFVLGLDFDGTAKAASVGQIWGEKLFDKTGGTSNFILINNDQVQRDCLKTALSTCLPVSLKNLGIDSVDNLVKSSTTLVYRVGGGDLDGVSSDVPSVAVGVGAGKFSFIQNGEGAPSGAVPTQFHRLIHVQPFQIKPEVGAPLSYDAIRVSSMVSWTAGGIEKRVVLTSELTDWK